MKVEPKIGIDSKTRAKPRVWAKFLLLVSFLGLFELANLNLTDFGRVKPNAQLLGKIFLLDDILFTLTKLFLKWTSYIIRCEAYKIIK